MKNIWILNNYVMPPQFGMRHYKFAEFLIKKGYKVRIFTSSAIHHSDKNLIKDSRKYLYKEFNNVPFIFIKSRNYRGNNIKRILNMFDYTIGLLIVSKKFDFEKPDVIYASSPHPLTWLAGYKLAKKYNAKFIAETRDLWPETFVATGKIKKNNILTKILYKLEKFIYKKANKLIFTFPGGKDYVESLGLDSSKVEYINNGVDLEEFNRNKHQYEYKDKELDNDKNFKVVYTGSMGLTNYLDILIKAAKLIQEKGIENIQFILFGDGYHRKELEQYVKINNIKNVIFKGKVENKYIPNILSKSDLNVFPGKNINIYKYGISPNKLFEYFASGKPTLSSNECEYDIIKQYSCGITVKGGSAKALAEGILKFYNMSKEEYKIYCRNALKAAQDFDYKILTEKLEKVILEN